jgi:hypothetical protein
MDDTERFFKDLGDGKPISLLVAPAVATNFPDYKRIFTWLKSMGVRKIYDVSLGADLCIWAHLRYIEQFRPFSLITSDCPVVVSYCELYRPELLPRLSPVHSPIGCLSVFMREYEGITDSLAAMTPCIAKSNEFDSAGTVDYNVTFAKLSAFMKSQNIFPTDYDETGFDHQEAGLGRLFPTPGGFKENIEYFLGNSIRTDKAEGTAIYSLLDEYAEADVKLVPRIFHVLNCRDGCNIGTGGLKDVKFFNVQSRMSETKRLVQDNQNKMDYEANYRKYDETFDLNLFLRRYSPETILPEYVSEDDIAAAFKLLGKDTYAKQNFNCGACGSATCLEMAHKIALRVNIPLNCVIKSRDEMVTAHHKIAQYIELIHHIGEYMLATVGDDISGSVEHALMALCYAMEGTMISVWKTEYDHMERPKAHRLLSFPNMTFNASFNTITVSDLPGWLEVLSEGNNLLCLRSKMNTREKKLFIGRNLGTIFCTPIMAQGDFWGFVSLVRREERAFNEEEKSVIVACSVLIASNMLHMKSKIPESEQIRIMPMERVPMDRIPLDSNNDEQDGDF